MFTTLAFLHISSKIAWWIFTCMRKRALIHLPFICGGCGRILLVSILFYSVLCFWLTALVPDFLRNRHLAFPLSPTYSPFRSSCKQAREFHSLGPWEYTWSCSHFRVDFSPPGIFVIARCLGERAASVLRIVTWEEVAEHLWLAVFLTSL